MSFIKANLENIKERITQAAKACGRSPEDIQLLAVSKTFPAEDVRTCFDSGQRAFGENYVQEGVAKIASLQDLRAEIKWHFIGPLQSNKSRDVAENFDWVHSIDRLKIAQRLNDQRPSNLPRLNVCIQVNISGESSKSGVQANDLIELCKQISELPNLLLRGLMSIPEPTDDVAQQRQAHHELRQLLEILKSSEELDQSKMQLDTLSMGMSSDIEAAIAEGSTMVRVGTAIFGKRTYL
ncbi:MAG: YggS family pyridoxal phosphate-dependent enzyme [Polynucleobacter victoriensis]